MGHIVDARVVKAYSYKNILKLKTLSTALRFCVYLIDCMEYSRNNYLINRISHKIKDFTFLNKIR